MTERLSMIADLARNPAANPTATAIGIAIVAILMLLVIVGLLAWVLPGSSRARPAAPSKKPAAPVEPAAPPSPARVWAVRALISVLVLAAIGVFYGMTSQSSFCGTTCHAMLTRGDTWAKSSHADVPCVRCHEGMPVVSAPAALVSRSHSVYAQLTGRTAEGGSSVPASRCMECHASIMEGVSVSKSGLAMAHRQVVDRGSTCEDCHGLQGHEKKDSKPTMASCLRCHDGETASAACSTCHRRTAQTISGASADTRFGTVRLPNKPTCEGCHPQDTCDRCHGLRMPHPTDFSDPKRHARLAAFSGKETLCYRCHTPHDCGPCHITSFVSHGKDWLHVHRKYPRNTTWCRGCHSTRDMCALCH